MSKKRGRRRPTPAEWGAITSKRSVTREVPRRDAAEHRRTGVYAGTRRGRGEPLSEGALDILLWSALVLSLLGEVASVFADQPVCAVLFLLATLLLCRVAGGLAKGRIVRKERRQLTRRELRQLTGRRPVVRRIPPPDASNDTSRAALPDSEGRSPSDRGKAYEVNERSA